MKRVFKIVSVVLSVISLVLFITGIILRENGYAMNYEFWGPLESYFVEFGFFGLFSYIYLMLKFEDKILRFAFTGFAIVSVGVLGLVALMGTRDIEVIENEQDTVYVSSYWYLLGGNDRLYQRENFFVSKYIAQYDTSDNNYVSYEIDNGSLIVTNIWDSDNIETYSHQLD